MSKRALILWACIGTLLFSAARILPSSQFSSDGPTQSAVEIPAPKASSSEEKQFQLLSAAYGPSLPPVEQPRLSPASINESTVWLARAIYSETKLPHEQELVAWVVRNRVETQYRGHDTYRDVVLDPYQFSAFNPGTTKRSVLLSLTPEVQLPAWQQALWIAHYVRHANSAFRPFSIQTRHFYSERSMDERRHPYWVNRQHFVSPGWDYEVDERRFRFYKEIS